METTPIDPDRAGREPAARGTLKALPVTERPREKLRQHGAATLSTAELLAILLRTGKRNRNVVEVAQQILQRHPAMHDLSRLSLDDLCAFEGVGPEKAVTLMAAFELGRRAARDVPEEAPLLDDAQKVAAFLHHEFYLLAGEELHVLLLNPRKRLIRMEKVSTGLADCVHARPRDILRPVIAANAAAFILVHNHPSGDPEPSPQDVQFTRDLIRCCQLLHVDFLDHLVFGGLGGEGSVKYRSLQQMGLFAQELRR